MNLALLLSLLSLADDRALYVNGVAATTLKNTELRSVNVRIDEKGNVWIEAPQYKVEVQSPGGSASSATPTATAPAGRYWLVTEDNASNGHVVEVMVNGVMVQKISSGDAQVILDIGKYLKPGMNTVVFNALPAQTLGGGVLNVYVGTGGNQGGTLALDAPQIAFSRRSTDPVAGTSRSFQLEVK